MHIVKLRELVVLMNSVDCHLEQLQRALDVEGNVENMVHEAQDDLLYMRQCMSSMSAKFRRKYSALYNQQKSLNERPAL